MKVTGFLAGALFTYILAYWLLLEPVEILVIRLPGTTWRERLPRYRGRFDTVAVLFEPIHRIDRRIRPGFWSEEPPDREEPFDGSGSMP